MSAAQEIGLLEQAELVIAAEDGDGRALLDGAGQPAGRARWRGGSWWRRWLFPLLVVREEPDLPLVFTLERRWSLLARWRVRDAEGEAVGTLAGEWLLDRWDRPLVYHRLGHGGPSGCFVDAASGQYLATWRRTEEGTRLTFVAGDDPDPFTRMLLIGALLCRAE
jgi:hypothetical protein